MDNSIKDKIIYITGGAKGLGRVWLNYFAAMVQT